MPSDREARPAPGIGNRAAVILVLVLAAAISVALLARRSLHERSLQDHAPPTDTRAPGAD